MESRAKRDSLVGKKETRKVMIVRGHLYERPAAFWGKWAPNCIETWTWGLRFDRFCSHYLDKKSLVKTNHKYTKMEEMASEEK